MRNPQRKNGLNRLILIFHALTGKLTNVPIVLLPPIFRVSAFYVCCPIKKSFQDSYRSFSCSCRCWRLSVVVLVAYLLNLGASGYSPWLEGPTKKVRCQQVISAAYGEKHLFGGGREFERSTRPKGRTKSTTKIKWPKDWLLQAAPKSSNSRVEEVGYQEWANFAYQKAVLPSSSP